MSMPAKLLDLFYFECRACHEEISTDAKIPAGKGGREVSAIRRNICPHCKIGGAVHAVPQGPAGAWTKFFLWQEGKT